MKKVLSIISIVAGGLVLLGVIVPMIIGAVLSSQPSGSVGFIGGADGPTAVFVVGTLGAGGVIIESVIGVLLVAVGIWGLIRCKK
ncbi:MAG: oxaloacetate decarboxylase [Lachnospiraceae bacterium]|nr:oxaloacetate decarboxylase [Lachnospiraceae bacterium]